MRRHAAERLLGGFAAGILTDPEKQVLFRAALEHQELFDALADEEALRELLADPATRQRLLAVLAKPRRLWQRPAVLGLAASLFLLVTTSLVLLRRPAAPVLLSSLPAPGEATLQNSDASRPGPAAARPAESAQPQPAQVRPAQVRPAEARRAKAAPSVPAPEAQATLDVAARDAAPPKGLAAGSGAVLEASKRALAESAKEEASTRLASPPGAAEAKQAVSAGFAKKGRALTSVLEPLEAGRFRLTVRWETPGHLYVLKRTPAGVEPVKARATGAGKAATFELSLGDQDALDVYLLRLPQEDPISLPASREVPGEWQRVFPE